MKATKTGKTDAQVADAQVADAQVADAQVADTQVADTEVTVKPQEHLHKTYTRRYLIGGKLNVDILVGVLAWLDANGLNMGEALVRQIGQYVKATEELHGITNATFSQDGGDKLFRDTRLNLTEHQYKPLRNQSGRTLVDNEMGATMVKRAAVKAQYANK